MSQIEQTASPTRRLDVQGLRAIAVLMVVGFHAGLPMPGGFAGVDVFFVVSGFVITAMLLREANKSGTIRLGNFYVRRFKRLIPALATMVAVTMVASLFLISPIQGQEEAAKTGIGAMLFAANIVLARITGGYFDTAAELNPLLHTWSLSVEEQFYFVFPLALTLALVIAKRLGRVRPVLVTAVTVIGVLSVGVMIAGLQGIEIPIVPNWLIGFFAVSTRAWEFAAGSLLALGWSRLAERQVWQRAGFFLAATGSTLLLASLWLIDSATAWPSAWTLLPVAGTLLLITAGLNDRTIFHRFLQSRAMVAIGDRSYSIYLWHWPFIVFAHILWSPDPWILATAALLSLVPAYASYRWIEQPLRLHKARRGWPLARLVSFTVGPALVLSAIVYVSAQTNLGNPTFNKFEAQLGPHHLAIAKGCYQQGWQSPSSCSWNTSAKGAPIYLVGDSNADHFSEALLGSSNSLSRPLVNITHDGCPFPDIRPRSTMSDRPECAPLASNTMAYLKNEAEPGIVVLSSSWRQYLFDDSTNEVPRSGSSSMQTLQTLNSSLTATIDELQESGHIVVIVQTIPHWILAKRPLNWVSCSVFRLARDGCLQTMSLNEVSRAHRQVAEVLDEVAHKSAAHIFDVSNSVCTETECTSIRDDGLAIYRDSGHITVPQSKELAPIFTRELAKAIDANQS
ncbi:MAG TPA: acyltransferase family protein [Aeromicrobium sp.]|nr:acyltransferase family protein [Aeromicrobium sp.]